MSAEGQSADRHGLQVLPEAECWDRLASTPVGRIAFIFDGEPAILPVNHAVSDRSIVFRTTVGSKLHAAHTAQIVAFEVDHWEETSRTGWSVLARGRADAVRSEVTIREFEKTRLEPWLGAVADGTWIRIRVNEISGRRLPSDRKRLTSSS